MRALSDEKNSSPHPPLLRLRRFAIACCPTCILDVETVSCTKLLFCAFRHIYVIHVRCCHQKSAFSALDNSRCNTLDGPPAVERGPEPLFHSAHRLSGTWGDVPVPGRPSAARRLVRLSLVCERAGTLDNDREHWAIHGWHKTPVLPR